MRMAVDKGDAIALFNDGLVAMNRLGMPKSRVDAVSLSDSLQPGSLSRNGIE
jgi:hypothetical protein